MKPTELKQQFIEARADGKSYSTIAEELHISKSTCTAWERELKDQIDALKREQLNALCVSYGMTKEARIKKLGDTLESINTALENVDFNEIAPEKLLDFKLKYTEALKEEYISTSKAYTMSEHIDAKEIVTALGDLLNRVRAGEVTAEQAGKESIILSNLLKAYDIAEIKTKLDELGAIVGGRK